MSSPYFGAYVGRWLYLPTAAVNVDAIRAKFVARSTPHQSYDKLVSVNLYDDTVSGFIGIPRHAGMGLLRDIAQGAKPRNDTVRQIAVGFRCPPIKPRIGQAELIRAMVDSYHSDNSLGLLISADPAAGKTIISLEAIRQIGVRSLVLVHTELLMNQWIEKAKKFLRLKDSEIGIAQGERCDWQGKKLVVGMIQSVMREKFGKAFEEAFGVVIIDEVHKVGAEKFSTVVRLFPAKGRYGLSGTMVRQDGLDLVYRWHVGDVVTAKLKAPPKPKVFKVRYSAEWQRDPAKFGLRFTKWNGELNLSKLITTLSEDRKRNTRLSNIAMKAFAKNRRVLMVSDRRAQCEAFAENIRAGIGEEHVGLIMGNVNHNAGDVHEGDVPPVLIATYGVLETGVDVPSLDCLIYGTPRARPKQVIGRIQREEEGKPKPSIVDMVDDFGILEGFWGARRKLYEKEGYEIVEV